MEPVSSHRVNGTLVALVVVAGLARLALWTQPLGFLTGDDVEILASGFSPATGLDYRPWELRNLLLPRLLVTPAVWLAQLAGIGDPVLLVRLAEVPFLLLSLVNILLVGRLAQRVAEPATGRQVLLLSVGIYGFHWLPLAYGATAYPRTASTTCVLLATGLLMGSGRHLARGVGAGGLLAVAFAVRYSEGVFLLPLALLGFTSGLEHRLTLRRALGLAAGFVGGGLLTVGLVDWWTWGAPFASLAEFARYTLVEHQASSRVAEQPWHWYLKRASFWLVPPLLPLLWARPRRQVLGFWLLFLLPLVMLSMVHHKEMRYLQAVIPFLAILAADGAARWGSWGRGWRLAGAALLCLGLAFSLRTAWRVHERGSQAAVAAARLLAAEGCVKRVVLTQAWAYGIRLILGSGVEITQFERAPDPEVLRAALEGADAAGFYTEDLERQPELIAVLEASGFQSERQVTVGESHPVTLFLKRMGRCSPGFGSV